MEISYRPAGFASSSSDPQLQPGERTLIFTRAALLRSVVTVGRRNITDVLQYGDLSNIEIIWRTAMLLANVRQRSDNALEWSPVYGGLDPSERGAVSYFVGMSFAKLMCERLLRVPWLMHLDVYQNQLSPAFQSGDERPDLVGLDACANWIAVEAKGGAGNLKSVGWARAKRQLANLETVNGVAVHQRVAAVTFQRRRNRSPRLHVEFRDPPADGEGFNLPVSPEQLVSDYYQRIQRIIGKEYALLPSVVSASGSHCVGTYVPEVDCWIGIAEEIARSSAPYKPATAHAEMALERRGARGATTSEELADVGLDGIAVVLGESWRERFTPVDRLLRQAQKDRPTRG